MFVITDRDRQHLLLQAQTAMDQRAADTLMDLLPPAGMSHLATKSDLKVAVARLETKIAETHTKMWRIAFMLLFGQAILPPIAERLLEKF